jgi:hypothetical protein
VDAHAAAVVLARTALIGAFDAVVGSGEGFEDDAESVAAILATVDLQTFSRWQARAPAVGHHARDGALVAVYRVCGAGDATRVAAPRDDTAPVDAFDLAPIDVHVATGVADAVQGARCWALDRFRTTAAAVARSP